MVTWGNQGILYAWFVASIARGVYLILITTLCERKHHLHQGSAGFFCKEHGSKYRLCQLLKFEHGLSPWSSCWNLTAIVAVLGGPDFGWCLGCKRDNTFHETQSIPAIVNEFSFLQDCTSYFIVSCYIVVREQVCPCVLSHISACSPNIHHELKQHRPSSDSSSLCWTSPPELWAKTNLYPL